MTRRAGFGLDFGTTNSVAAYYDPNANRTTAATDANGRPHPSFLWYQAGKLHGWGAEARSRHSQYEGQAGHEFYSSMKTRLGVAHEGTGSPALRTTDQVVTDYLAALRAHAVNRLPAFEKAVLTIPSSFDGRRRRALRAAAERAGIHVRAFVHEPFAAVVGYIAHADRIRHLHDGPIVVFDWGGGTLDITVARLESGILSEAHVEALEGASGDHFDALLARHAITRWMAEKKRTPEGGTPLSTERSRIHRECENCKITLSERSDALIDLARVRFTSQEALDLEVQISRGEFQQIIDPDATRAMTRLTTALEQARVRSSEVGLALAIGGTSKIPMVRQRLLDMFGSRLVPVPNADTVIAEGAAAIDGLGLEPVLARDIEVELANGAFMPVFRAGTPVRTETCQTEIQMYCTDNRDGTAKLVVTEGKGDDHENPTVLPIPVSTDRWRPGYKERVMVNIWVDHDYILRMRGRSATRPDFVEAEEPNIRFGLKIPEAWRA